MRSDISEPRGTGKVYLAAIPETLQVQRGNFLSILQPLVDSSRPMPEPFAVSLKPEPDVYYYSPWQRARFLEALQREYAMTLVSCCPIDPRYVSYQRRAERNRNSIAHATVIGHVAVAPSSQPDHDFYKKASRKAFEEVSHNGLPWWAEEDDLTSIGYQAIAKKGSSDMALASLVAHSAMVDYLRKEDVRQRDRVWASGAERESDGLLDGERTLSFSYPEEPFRVGPYATKQPGQSGRTAAVWDAANTLQGRQRQAIMLYLSGCGHAEIAEQMAITPKAVERLLARAREAIKEILSASRGI